MPLHYFYLQYSLVYEDENVVTILVIKSDDEFFHNQLFSNIIF